MDPKSSFRLNYANEGALTHPNNLLKGPSPLQTTKNKKNVSRALETFKKSAIVAPLSKSP